jgi:hypothetical protein
MAYQRKHAGQEPRDAQAPPRALPPKSVWNVNADAGSYENPSNMPKSSGAPAKKKDDDEGISDERLAQLRQRVKTRELKARVETIMNCYYVILLVAGGSFWYSLDNYGVDQTVTWFLYGGLGLLLFAFFTNLVANRLDHPILQAVAGMIAITGIPIIAVALFTFVWISMFFKESWREMWLGLVDRT